MLIEPNHSTTRIHLVSESSPFVPHRTFHFSPEYPLFWNLGASKLQRLGRTELLKAGFTKSDDWSDFYRGTGCVKLREVSRGEAIKLPGLNLCRSAGAQTNHAIEVRRVPYSTGIRAPCIKKLKLESLAVSLHVSARRRAMTGVWVPERGELTVNGKYKLGIFILLLDK